MEARIMRDGSNWFKKLSKKSIKASGKPNTREYKTETTEEFLKRGGKVNIVPAYDENWDRFEEKLKELDKVGSCWNTTILPKKFLNQIQKDSKKTKTEK